MKNSTVLLIIGVIGLILSYFYQEGSSFVVSSSMSCFALLFSYLCDSIEKTIEELKEEK